MRKLGFLFVVVMGIVGCGGAGSDLFAVEPIEDVDAGSEVSEDPIEDAGSGGAAHDSEPDAVEIEIEDWWDLDDGPAPLACKLPGGRIEKCVDGAPHLIFWTSNVTKLPAFCNSFQPASMCEKGAACTVIDNDVSIQGTCLGDVVIDD